MLTLEKLTKYGGFRMYDKYVSPFSTRYASDEMQQLFSCLLYTSCNKNREKQSASHENHPI